MTETVKARMEARIEELQKMGVDLKNMSIQCMGCCGRADGSYRCSSK